VPLADLILDPKVQAREDLNEEVISDYAELMRDGAQFPPIEAYRDREGRIRVSDGVHRVLARRRTGATDIIATVRPGEPRDAQFAAIGSNIKHGARRTNADKRRAVLMMLGDEQWRQLADREIARHCGVSPTFVGNLRAELSANAGQMETVRTVTRGGTVFEMETANIGTVPAEAEPVVEPAEIDPLEPPEPPAPVPPTQPIAADGGDPAGELLEQAAAPPIAPSTPPGKPAKGTTARRAAARGSGKTTTKHPIVTTFGNLLGATKQVPPAKAAPLLERAFGEGWTARIDDLIGWLERARGRAA
jgi:hypothetical protein